MRKTLAENVLLSGNTAKGLLKCALQEGFVDIIEPSTESERHQIQEFQKNINKSRSSQNSLYLGLLAETIFLDEPSIGGLTVFEDLDDEERLDDAQSIFSSVSQSLVDFIELTNPTVSYYAPMSNDLPSESPLSLGYHADKADLADTCNLLEPLIWARCRRSDALKFVERKYFREVFDRNLVDEQFRDVFFSRPGEELEDAEGVIFLAEMFPEYDPEEYWRFIYLLRRQSSMVLSKVREAEKVNAKLPLVGWLDKNVNFDRKYAHKFPDMPREAVASIKVILPEFRYFPAINTLHDLLKVRDNPEYTRFKSFLDEWVCAASNGDVDTEARLRTELKIANASLNKSVKCTDIGRYVTYIGLPMIALDLMVGPFFGTPTTIGGFGIQGYSDWINRKNRWVLVGR